MSLKENQNNINYNIEKSEVLVGSSLLRKKNIKISDYINHKEYKIVVLSRLFFGIK
jgi:hypothetical protein